MNAKYLLAACALLASACSPLTAEHPLFSPADQIGPPPLTEGFWVFIDDECPRAIVERHGRLPRDCHPFELRRSEDGAWRLSGSARDKDGHLETIDMRIIVAPAVEHPSPDAFSPLYLAEYIDPDKPQATTPNYAAIAPVGTLPATEAMLLAQIDCSAVLRDGPVAGVTERRDSEGKTTGCVAENQSAVREAARRAVIQGLSEMEHQRMMFVRP